jgi:uridylate kinase
MEFKVLSIGGSILVQDTVDTDFIEKLIELLKTSDNKFILVVGGGKIARLLATANPNLTNDAKDRIGIATTRANAQLLIENLIASGLDVNKTVLTDTDIEEGHNIYIMGGLTPGRTTDDVATQMAIKHGAKTVINLSNIDGVYNKDPKLPDANFLPKLSWDNFLSMFDTHAPGIHAPFDPVAAKRAKENGLQVIVANKDTDNLKKILDGSDEMLGTIIE